MPMTFRYSREGCKLTISPLNKRLDGRCSDSGIAGENPGWGYGRIQGALANVGHKISGTTVGNILREKGSFPSPERGKQSNWKRFIRSHMDVTAVADFFTVEVWTLRGLVCYHVLFVMKLAQRQVRIVHIGCQLGPSHDPTGSQSHRCL
jgi:hypothetical protein